MPCCKLWILALHVEQGGCGILLWTHPENNINLGSVNFEDEVLFSSCFRCI